MKDKQQVPEVPGIPYASPDAPDRANTGPLGGVVAVVTSPGQAVSTFAEAAPGLPGSIIALVNGIPGAIAARRSANREMEAG